MRKASKYIASLWKDRKGITAIEYAVLAGGIAIALTAVFSGTGVFDDLQTKLETIITNIDDGS